MNLGNPFGPIALVMLSSAALCAVDASAQTGTTSCVACHASLPQPALAAPAKALQGDVHQQRGFGCADCHGGNSVATEKAEAHNAARGYRGKPAGQQIVATCGRCHSDAEFMHKFAPQQRVDQATEYGSSVHGKRLADGDTRVATCVTCHGAHGVRPVNDARSPAFPTNVAATCGACHSLPEHMKPYTLPDGRALPTNQRAEYERSVHYTALVKQNDMSAPTCNDCHGNHGAAPPGVTSLTTVCGTCHAIFQTKFAASVHAQIFEKACIECHSNHAVLTPSDTMLGTSKPAVCASCHEDKDDPGFVGAARMQAGMDRLKGAIDSSSALIDRVKNAGMEVGDQELALNEARTKLVLARTEVHAFDPVALDAVVADAAKILTGVDQAGTKALGELAYRRRGLFVSLGVILLVVMALAFKIRDLNKEEKN
jgi:predicted CXXCH cytochrome family protein